jgi:LruC domain-containing protein
MKVRTGLLFASSAALLTMTGCVDQDRNLFDAEATAALYASAFPVDNIDPDMDWTTTRSASLSVAVEEDAGVDYTVRVFTDDPLAENTTAKLLAEGVARKGQPFTAKIDVPSALGGVYITRTDEHNRHLLKYVSVSNNAVATTFGASAVDTRAISSRTAASLPSFPVLSPEKSEAEVLALYNSATEADANVDFGGKTLKVSEGNTLTLNKSGQLFYDNWSSNGSYLIVKGTLVLPSEIIWAGDKARLYVLDGGKIILSSGLSLNGNSVLTVYKGGTIEGSGTLNVKNCGPWPSSYYNDSYLSDYSTHNVFYNAGTIKVDKIIGANTDFYNDKTGVISGCAVEFNAGKDTFINLGTADLKSTNQELAALYNSGTLTVTDLESHLVNTGTAKATNAGLNYNKETDNYGTFEVTNTYHGTLTNNGKTEIGQTKLDDNNVLINNCYFICNGDFRGDITTAENTMTDIRGNLNTAGAYSYTIAANSMIKVGGAANLNTAAIVGPAGEDFGLFRINEIAGFQLRTGDSSNPCHVYIESDNISDTSESNITSAIEWLSSAGGACSKIGDANFTLPEGDCTGEGTKPNSEGNTDLDLIPQISYTYAFEDNYPQAGDYDFNDVVLGVTVKNNQNATTGAVESVDVEVVLKAVGATNTVGAGLRLYGMDKSKVGDVTLSGDDASAFTTTLSSSQFEAATKEDAGNNKYVVIPLFGDAHKVLGVNGHIITNTYVNATPVAAKTLKINIKTSEEISLENLDFFITNGRTSEEGRTEIHLYNFLVKNGSVNPDAATSKGTIEPNNAEVLASNGYTWAIYAPDFRYPKETIKISTAYPDFVKWASNHTQNEDWYSNPNSDKLY